MAEKELKPDFKAEYAKSNRSSCKGCSDKLEKDLVRIGKLERAANFDGEIYVWFHPRCFFNKHGSLVKDVNDIKGLTDLRWDDQQTLKKFVGGEDENEDEEMEDDNVEGVVVEYAKSGRAKCKSCYQTIANKELRIGEQYRDEDNGYSGTNWYHLKCFTVPDSIESVKDLDGYSKIKPADKKLVETHFTSAFKTNSKKRKEREDDKEERAAKRQKTDDTERQRVEQLWKIKDKLKKKYNANEIKAILKFNDQSYHGGPQELIDRAADGELNGALPLCSECKKGHLYLDAGQIKCHGYLSAWSKCTFTCPPSDIKERAKWKYPSDDEMDELIDKIKDDKNKDKAPGVTISHPELFNDLLFSFVGDVSDKETLTESITQRGGQVNANVVKKVTHIISTYDEVSKAKQTTKIANAIKWDIPILSSGFINKSIEDGNLNSLEDFKLWKDDKAVQVDDKYQVSASNNNNGPKQRKKLAIPPVDEKCSLATGGSILVEGTDVYATMLNMTDLTQGQSGRNSFYLMMIVTNAKKNKFVLFRKWGRVGQEDAPTTEGEYSKDDAIAEFERIFFEKTKNTWDQFLEDTYEKKPGKFFPIELGGDEEEPVDDAKLKRAKEILQAGTTCKLDSRVQELVKLLFDTNMFKEQMKEMKIDVKKMPLGKLSKTQLTKGVAVLEEIEEELKKDKPSSAFLLDASNRFYTIVPHDFGYEKPVPIDNKEFLQKKFDLIEILGDIEVAARMLEEEGKMGTDPITEQYLQLKNEIKPVERDSDEWKRIQTFWDNTRENKNITIEEIYTVNRQGERDLFTPHNKLDTRKLLWHGSKVAVFAAILSGGLKIMPHAGGRVGRGLYFADMISKSEQYLGLHGDIGLVLLNEVALGKIHRIQHDRPDLVKAPSGTSAVLAEGSVQPDPKFEYEDKTLSPSGFPVLIPQGKVVNSGVRGSFMHNEFLVYDQTQASMRYLIKLRNKNRGGWF